MSNVGTLVDGNPDNNFLKESETIRFNPNGALTGASFVAAAGHRLYMTTPRGLFVIEVWQGWLAPAHRGRGDEWFPAQSTLRCVQFRYAFVTDDDGLKVLDITNPTSRFRCRTASCR